jgi:hypothetical protein
MIKVFKPMIVHCIHPEKILALDIRYAIILNKVVRITQFARKILQDQHAHFAIKMKDTFPKTEMIVYNVHQKRK